MFLVSLTTAWLALLPRLQTPYGVTSGTLWPAILSTASALGIAATILTFLALEVSWKPDLNVIAKIVAILYKDGPTKRTNLSSRAGLNYSKSFPRYLRWMTDAGLIYVEKNEEGLWVFLTPLGRNSHSFFVALLDQGNTASPFARVAGKGDT
jgi:predicted transcriptional regulator